MKNVNTRRRLSFGLFTALVLGTVAGLVGSNKEVVGSKAATEHSVTITRSNFASGSLAYGTDDLWTTTSTSGEVITGYFDIYSIEGQENMQTRTKTPIGSYPYNIDSLPGNITKIELSSANTGTARSWTPYLSKTALTKSNYTSGTGQGAKTPTNGQTALWEISTENEFRYFYINMTGGAAYLDSIKVYFDTNIGTTYTVSFNSDGGSNITSQIVSEGSTASKPADPTKNRHSFVEWRLNGIAYDFDATVNADLTLVAHWEEITYFDVTFDSNGGSAIATVEVPEGETLTKPENPTRVGFRLKAWQLNGVDYDFDTPVTSNITLVAIWELVVEILEDFEGTTNLTTDYADNEFVGAGGVTFTYGHSRDQEKSPIDGKGIMLRRASDSYLEFTLSNGLKNLSFQYRRGFTGTSERQLEVLQDGVQIATTDTFGDNDNVFLFEKELDVPAEGSVTIKIKNVGSTTTNRQIVIDNLTWIEYNPAKEFADWIMGHEGGDITTVDCEDKFLEAWLMWDELSSEAQDLFMTHADFEDALARVRMWAVANDVDWDSDVVGDGGSHLPRTSATNSPEKALQGALIIGIFGLTTLAGYYFLRKRRVI